MGTYFDRHLGLFEFSFVSDYDVELQDRTSGVIVAAGRWVFGVTFDWWQQRDRCPATWSLDVYLGLGRFTVYHGPE